MCVSGLPKRNGNKVDMNGDIMIDINGDKLDIKGDRLDINWDNRVIKSSYVDINEMLQHNVKITNQKVLSVQ